MLSSVTGRFAKLYQGCEDVLMLDELARETDGASTLQAYIDKGVTINSYKELMPRMNDIFIKLVTEGEGA